MRWRRLAKLVLLSAAGGAPLVGCGSSADDHFIVRVRGAEGALSTFNVRVDGMKRASDLEDGSDRVFRVDGPAVLSRNFIVHSGLGPNASLSEVSLQPYLCRSDPSGQAHLGEGWSATETHEVWLNADGVLEVDTDFEHVLNYRCEWLSPNGDGEGSGTILSRPPLCADSDRSASRLMLEMTNSTFASAAARTCLAIVTNYGFGTVELQLTFDVADGEMSGAAAYCLRSPDEAAPVQLTVGSTFPDPGCIAETVSLRSQPRVWNPNLPPYDRTGGFWNIESFAFSKGSRLVSDIDLDFELQGSSSVHARVYGHVDLPIVRVPVN